MKFFFPSRCSALLSFLLTPLVNRLERFGLGRVVSVVLYCFGLICSRCRFWAGSCSIRLSSSAIELPEYRSNLIAKVRSIREAGGNLKEVTKTIEDVGKELTDEARRIRRSRRKVGRILAGKARLELCGCPVPRRIATPNPQRGSGGGQGRANASIAAHADSRLAGPLVAPMTTGGIVIVLVIFILLQREDIRDRIIQLFGTGNLHTTTEAITDAASRVSGYLRMNLLINACYGIGVAAGLYFIGLPNAALWGVMGMLLRFLPYLGPWIAASMPILLSLAVFDNWSATFLVLGLFVVLELLVNNVLEPLLYGSVVGVSSLGIVVAAIFWTWLWGPVGLVLAVPLTVCLVVTGQYVPQFRFFTVLFSDRSTLSRFGEALSTTAGPGRRRGRKADPRLCGEEWVEELFDQVMIPALELAERDRHNGILSEECASSSLETMEDLIDAAMATISETKG